MPPSRLLAACSGDDGAGTASTTTEQATTTTSEATTTTTKAATYGDAMAVIDAINGAGIKCVEDGVDDNEPGGGAASVEFCTVNGHRVQVVTFDGDAGKTAWLGLAKDIGKSYDEFGCAVGENFAACPDPEAGASALAKQIATALGVEAQDI